MKRVILSILAFFSISTVYAEPIKVITYWGWNYDQLQTSVIKSILDQANKDQKKYEFVLTPTPGAVGTVATRKSLEAPKDKSTIHLIAHAPGYFTRPLLHKDAGYSLDQFTPVFFIGEQKLVLITKGRSIEDLRKSPKLTVFIFGPGSMTHLVLIKNGKTLFPNTELIYVPYPSWAEALVAVQGGHLDITIGYVNDVVGRPDIKNAGPLGAAADFFILAPSTVDAKVNKELHAILAKAEQNKATQELYKNNAIESDQKLKSFNNLNKWYTDSISRYKDLTKDFKLQ
jgi:tripartite-type tricarboxylate transporter receptor subunit TctC